MDFDLSEEHEAFRKVVRDFAEHEIAPHAERWDREHAFPLDVVRSMGELGLFGLPFPARYGGSDADFTTLCVAIEELARVDSSIAITLEAAVGLGAAPIAAYGTEEQRRQWLPDLCAGRALAAFGLSEPDAGSDAGATRTRARLDGDEWVIDGAKAFITNSGTPITALVTATARTGPGREITAIVVPAATPGLIVEPAYRKMGWHASDTHPVALRRLPGTGGEHPGCRGRGIAPVPRHPRRRPHRHRRARGRARAGVSRAERGVRRRAVRVRCADRRAPGRGVPLRRSRRDGGERRGC